MNPTTGTRTRIVLSALTIVLGFAVAACGSKSGSAAGAESSARGAIASATANPTTAADLHQAKMLVEHCFAGTPLQQAHQVHLVFLSRAAGKNGPAVVAARDKTAACMGISKSDEQPFFNDAITAAEHANPRLTTHAGRVKYFEITLAGLVLKYSNAASATGGPTPGISPSTTGASS
jgi:hypothetical protein